MISKIFDCEVENADGTTKNLSEFKGKTILIVNVASKCGLTPQFDQLEELQKKYASKNFTILAFPSNQFFQEPKNDTGIAEYCRATWGVTFPVFKKVKVNGKKSPKLYELLRNVEGADGYSGKIRWNFEKFLITKDGTIHRFPPTTKPNDPAIVSLIEQSIQS